MARKFITYKTLYGYRTAQYKGACALCSKPLYAFADGTSIAPIKLQNQRHMRRTAKGADVLTCGQCWKGGENIMETYKIVRVYKNSTRRKVIRRGLTLQDAQIWCSNPNTKKDGVWMDVFYKE